MKPSSALRRFLLRPPHLALKGRRMLDNQIAETRTGAYGAEVVDALASIGTVITHPLF